MANKSIFLLRDEKKDKIELPILEGTQGFPTIDITTLTHYHLNTFDPGFSSTAACQSQITFIDGEKGILLHRGYPIEQLVEHSSFLETAYLLMHGELPLRSQQESFECAVKQHMHIEPFLLDAIVKIPKKIHPMAMLSTLMTMLSGFYHEDTNIHSPENRIHVYHHLLAQMPILVALIYRHKHDLPFITPRNELSYSENFLHMMFSRSDKQPLDLDPVTVQALDRIFLLHADHGQNASTSSVRLIGSTGVNPYIAVVGGIITLWGPSHGGANEKVIEMLNAIGEEKNIQKFLDRSQDKNDPFRLMGFGHRVYKNFDPRAKMMKKICQNMRSHIERNKNPLFNIALKLEKIACENEYFIKRKLYPNVDFYSGILLKSLNIPTNMFTTIFALGRTSGWLSQWNEMISESVRISRPRQLYTGPLQRPYVPLSER